MPMDFPDLPSLLNAAEVWDFRKPEDGESEAAYRKALADHVAQRDLVESQEIRTGHGWDKFSERENAEMIGRAKLAALRKQP